MKLNRENSFNLNERTDIKLATLLPKTDREKVYKEGCCNNVSTALKCSLPSKSITVSVHLLITQYVKNKLNNLFTILKHRCLTRAHEQLLFNLLNNPGCLNIKLFNILNNFVNNCFYTTGVILNNKL